MRSVNKPNVKGLWCWRRLLRVPWTARRSNQSILKEISPGCSLERLMLKLKLQYFGTSCEELTHWKRLWCWEGLGAGGEGDDRGWDGWRASPTRWTWVEWTLGVGDGQEGLAWCDSWGRKASDMTEWLNWTEILKNIFTKSRWETGNEYNYNKSIFIRKWIQLVIF